MRLLFPVLALPLLIPAATSAQTAAPMVRGPQTTISPLAVPNDKCRKTTSYHAEIGSWRGDKVPPRKLTELPPADSYKAVYRTVNGCEEPMTVAEYHRGVIR